MSDACKIARFGALTESAAQAICIGNVRRLLTYSGGKRRFEAILVGRDGERAVAQPVIGRFEGNETVSFCRYLSHFHGGFDGFGARLAEQSAGEVAGRQSRQFFEKRYFRVGRVDIAHAMHEFFRLRAERGGKLGVCMSVGGDGETRAHVDVGIAVGVPKKSAVAACQDDRIASDADF